MTNIHYICDGGCEGVSEVPCNCGAETCTKHGLPLRECSCEDGKHNGAFEKNNERPDAFLKNSHIAES
jgi:hypothetical protein